MQLRIQHGKGDGKQVRSAECWGSAECGVMSAECGGKFGMRNAEFGVRSKERSRQCGTPDLADSTRRDVVRNVSAGVCRWFHRWPQPISLDSRVHVHCRHARIQVSVAVPIRLIWISSEPQNGQGRSLVLRGHGGFPCSGRLRAESLSSRQC